MTTEVTMTETASNRPSTAGEVPPTTAPARSANSGSLYVGDLRDDVSEIHLNEHFRHVGPVMSIRICRDAQTKKSLGYGYVNFQNPNDAEKAMRELNFTEVQGSQIRIMPCQRDPSARKQGKSNIFIRGLNPDIDNRSLYEVLVAFGNIQSVKVARDKKTGKSLGYGFVHYETEAAASDAALKVNGMLLNDKKVEVQMFIPQHERNKQKQTEYTNLYIKHFNRENVDEEALREVFGAYGTIKSLQIQLDKETGKSMGFGFCAYETHEDAVKAVEALHNMECDICGAQDGPGAPRKALYVQRAQSKQERNTLRESMRNKARAQFALYTNLYVKHIDDGVNSEQMREVFAKYGEVISAKVMVNPGDKEKAILPTSKGFGFVCFKRQEDAQKAQMELANRTDVGLGAKPLYINIAQKREARRMQLEAQHQTAGFGGRGGRGGRGMMGMGMGGMMGPYPNMYPMMGGGMMPTGWPGAGMGGGQNFPGQRGGGGNRGGGRGGQGNMMGGAMRPPAGMPPGGPPRGMPPMGGGKMPPMPNQMPPVMPQQQPRGPPDAGAINSTALAQMNPDQQKNALGERLYHKIAERQPALAAKITGMLLEMDNPEILNLLDTPRMMEAKIEEAVEVLRSHGQH